MLENDSVRDITEGAVVAAHVGAAVGSPRTLGAPSYRVVSVNNGWGARPDVSVHSPRAAGS